MSRTRARALPVLVQVTRVPASMASKLGLKEPPPPAIVTLENAIGSQIGCGLGLGLGLWPGLGDGLGLWPGDGLGLWPGDGLGLWPGDGLGLWPGLGDGFGPPKTVMVALTPLRASSICMMPGWQNVKENDWPGWRSPLSRKL
jgi:hypothetical protein